MKVQVIVLLGLLLNDISVNLLLGWVVGVRPRAGRFSLKIMVHRSMTATEKPAACLILASLPPSRTDDPVNATVFQESPHYPCMVSVYSPLFCVCERNDLIQIAAM